MILKHRDYLQVAQSNLELVRNDLWDVEFVGWPSSIYNPGSDLLKTRLNTVDLGSDSTTMLIEKKILGHTILSPGGRDGATTEITLNFIDREDLMVFTLAQDLLDKGGLSDNGFSRHVSELRWRVNFTFYDTLLKPKYRLEYYDGLCSGVTIPRAVGEHGGDNSEVAITIKFQHHKPFNLLIQK